MARAVKWILAVSVFVLPSTALAHGLGGRQDLPVPLEFFVVGAVVVLVASFLALAVLWPEPRLQADIIGAPRRARPFPRAVLGAIGAAGLLIVVVAGLVGEASSSTNPAPVLVFVWFWLVVPFAAAIVGDLYPDLDPWRGLRSLFGVSDEGREPGSLLPAALALLSFAWLELISPWQDPAHLAVAALLYTGYILVMGMMGRRAADVDGFAVYNRLFGAMAPWPRSGLRAPRGWLRGLPAIPEQPGLVLIVVIMIGTVTYDGASFTDWWSQSIEIPMSRVLFDVGLGSTAARTAAGTIAFLGVNAALLIAYLAASSAAARLGGSGTTRSVALRFAHTLVPIAFAYAFAHYFTLVLFEGQLLISTMSDPLGLGWDLFGTADRPISYRLITGSAVWVWYVQVAAIVIGHVAGVILAHDRALADYHGVAAVRSQYAMLALMVILTGLGLVILAAG